MPTSIVALNILLILLPGFAAAYIVQMLALRASQTDFDKVIEASLYSIVVYLSFMVLSRSRLPFELSYARAPFAEPTIRWFPGRLAGVVGLTACVALLATLYFNLDGTRMFRALKITERTSRRSIWNDILQSEAKQNQVVQIGLADGRSLLGVLKYYSDSAEECSVFLRQASWISAEGEQTEIPGAGILLTKASNISSISLLDN